MADYLQQEYGYRELSFAAPLKELIIKSLVSCPPPEHIILKEESEMQEPLHLWKGNPAVYWDERIRRTRTPFSRWMMQIVGTEIGRVGIDPDLWVKKWAEMYDPSVPTVVPDMRFLNEAKAVSALGGRLWRVVRTDAEEKNVQGVEHGKAHASEVEAEKIIQDVLIAVPTGIHFIHQAVDELLGVRS